MDEHLHNRFAGEEIESRLARALEPRAETPETYLQATTLTGSEMNAAIHMLAAKRVSAYA